MTQWKPRPAEAVRALVIYPLGYMAFWDYPWAASLVGFFACVIVEMTVKGFGTGDDTRAARGGQ